MSESGWTWSNQHKDYYKAVYGPDGSVAKYIWARDVSPKGPTQPSASTAAVWYSSGEAVPYVAPASTTSSEYHSEERRPQQPSRSYSAPPITTQSNKIDVEVKSWSGELKRAVALLDNGSDDYNWISPKLLARLGLQTYSVGTVRVSAGGHTVESNEIVNLEFKLPKGGSYNEVTCHVWPRNIGPVPDILLGHPYLIENKILQLDLSGLFPGQSLWPASQDEQAKQQAADARRIQEQAALEQRRQSQNTYTTYQGTPNQYQTQSPYQYRN